MMWRTVGAILVPPAVDQLTSFDDRRQRRFRHSLGRLFLVLALLGSRSIGVDGQETPQHGEVNLLPPARGEALTLTPNDMPDISCSVAQWKDDLATPTLAVICPPANVFAPIHVYLKLSWLRAEDVPPVARGITVAEKALVKVRTNRSSAWVWLGVREKQGGAPHRAWVAFNGVVDMALLTLPRRR